MPLQGSMLSRPPPPQLAPGPGRPRLPTEMPGKVDGLGVGGVDDQLGPPPPRAQSHGEESMFGSILRGPSVSHTVRVALGGCTHLPEPPGRRGAASQDPQPSPHVA